jgi:arylsulfate sulfotransferase
MSKPWVYFCLLVPVLAVGCGSSSQSVTSISPSAVALSLGQSIQFQTTPSESAQGMVWFVNGILGGNSTVGTIDTSGKYTAPSDTQSISVTIKATSGSASSSSVSAQVFVVAPGVVEPTQNPQVALYTITPPAAANVTIQFGATTNHGLSTWTQGAPTGGGPVSTFVAGMILNSTYHMQATLNFGGGVTFLDNDHTFATGTLQANTLPPLKVTTTPGMTPQSGVELLDLVNLGATGLISVLVTDLNGNILWTYNPGLPAVDVPNPIKLLPNGHFLINFAGAAPDGENSVLQEVDLSGQVVWQMTAAQLNKALAAATCTGCNITVVGTHHDFAVLPNGHLIVIAAQEQTLSGLAGYPNPVTVIGDVLIDLDQNRNPVWLWSTFDHLDPNRHPILFPDWTHTNSVVYSPDDKALILSMRNQSWVMKIDYDDGEGTGNILWKLGYQGNFALQGGTDPVDWFYAQHDANIISPNSSGTFQILLFDDGNDRVLDSSGTVCGSTVPCWTRVPILQLDETANTATLEWVDDLAPVFVSFGGSARLLANGNIEFAECAPVAPPGAPVAIYEVTKTSPPQTVWQMQIAGQDAYRGFRIPSLYPGVQW